MDGWKINFLLGRSIFRGYVSFREGDYPTSKKRGLQFSDCTCCHMVEPDFSYQELVAEKAVQKTVAILSNDDVHHKF